MNDQSRYIWLSGVLGSLLFLLVFYFFGYQPAADLIRQSHIDRVTERALIHRLLLDTEIERAIQGARSISSRTMIRNKIVDYKQHKIGLDDLRSYTGSKYRDGVRALDKFHGAVRITGTDTIAVSGFPVEIMEYEHVTNTAAQVKIEGDTLNIDVISPIKTNDGVIIGYDLVRMKDATSPGNVQTEGMTVQVQPMFSEKAEVLVGLDDVLVSEESDRIIFRVASSAGPFNYEFQARKADVLAPFMQIRADTMYVILILVLLLISNGMLLRKYLLHRNRNKLLILQNKVRDSEQNFEEIFAMSPAGIAITDQNGEIRKVNKVMTELLALPEEQLVGRSVLHEFSIQSTDIGDTDTGSVLGPLLEGKEISIFNSAGSKIDLLLSFRQIEHQGDDSFIVVAVDISELKRSRRLVEDALEEKNVLIAEIHHRVKNNLAMICGLLHLQVSSTDDPVLKTELMSSLSRVKTIADVHEITYESDQLSQIDMKANTESILKRLEQMYQTDERILIEVQNQEVQLGLSRALPLSQIINEVVSDQLQFGFDDHANGSVEISFDETADEVSLTIIQRSDLAIPFLFAQNTLSEQLVQALLHQLGAEPEIQYSEHDLIFRLPIPNEGVKQADRVNESHLTGT